MNKNKNDDITTTKISTTIGSGNNIGSQSTTDNIAYVKLDVIKNHATLNINDIDLKEASNNFKKSLEKDKATILSWVDEDTAHFE